MAQSPGVFSLENVEIKLREGEWATPDDYWRDEPTPNTGYQIGGGGPSNNHSGVSKTQFATDTTANISPTMIQSGGEGSTTTSSTALYAHAGFNVLGGPAYTTKTDKITYSTDTVSALPGNIPAPSSQGFTNSTRGIMGDNKAGYFAGGTNWPGNSVLSNIWKMPFASESVGQTPSGMPQNMNNRQAFSSATHGYMAAGNWPSGGSDSRIYKMAFSTDTGSNFSSPGPGNVGPARNGAGSSSPTDGYMVGGDYNYVYKIPFSSDTSSRLPSSNYPLSEVSGQAASGNTTHAYHAGGQGGPSGVRSSIFKFNYSTGSWSTISAMPVTRQFPKGGGSKSAPAGIYGAFSRSSDNAVEPRNHGYMVSGLGGPGNSARSNTFKLDMDLDTWSIATTMPGYHRYNGSSFGNTLYGYMVSGYGTPSPAGFTRVAKMQYSTETMLFDSNSWPNPYGGWGTAGVSNQVKGYSGGGDSPGSGLHGRVYKYDIPTDTVASNPVGGGSEFPGIRYASTSGNETESYWGSGYNNSYSHIDSGNWTQVKKLTYSSDTFSEQPSTFLYFPNPAANNKAAEGDGNSTHGYHGKAGYANVISYATGTFAPAPMYGGTGTGMSIMANSTESWQMGPSASQTGKYTFATGTGSYTSNMPTDKYESFPISIRGRGVSFPKPPTTTATSGTGFTYNPALPNFAIAGGGSNYSLFYKMDFATDVMTVPSARIYVPNQYYSRKSVSAASSATAGYFAGGNGGPGQGSGGAWAWVDKYTYSTDTRSAAPENSNLIADKPSAGNHEKGYWVAGGEYPQSSRDVSKLVYSTETWSQAPSARPGAVVRQPKVAGGPTDVWVMGGNYLQPNNQPSATPTYNNTTIGRIAYSNDTYSIVPSGLTNTVPGGYARAMSNSSAMYTGGNGIPIDKFTFATTTNALWGSLPYSAANAGSASNEGAGYWFFGKAPSGGDKTQKVNFSNGTTSVIDPGGPANIPNMNYVGGTSARSDANAGTSGPTIL